MTRLYAAATFAALLLTAPALAQQGPSPEQFVSSVQVELSDSLTRIKATLAAQDQRIEALQQQNAAAQKQVADLTKERDAIKAATVTPPAAEPTK